MRYHDFTSLKELDRADTAWKKGVLLAERTEGFHSLRLYRLNDFYVEVVYHTHFNVMLSVSSFTDEERLDAYLEQIDLSGLLS